MRYAMRLSLVVLIPLAGCSGMSSTEQRTLSGGAGGAGVGAVLGAIGGNAGLGALAGGGAGLLGGYLYDQYQKSQANAFKEGYDAGKVSPSRKVAQPPSQ